MELDDEFGFTRRDEMVLRKVLTSRTTVKKGLMEEVGELGDCGAQCSYSNNSNNKVEDKAKESALKNCPNSRSGFTLAATKGVVKGGATSPETGSDSLEKQQHTKASVARDTPNIPNVVEYHLKVKPQFQKDALAHQNTNSIEMKKEDCIALKEEEKKGISSKLSKLSINNNVFEGSSDLPQVFQVKYLGSHDARGLWGIKHTRKPVDNMVAAAKSLPAGTILPFIKLVISKEGVALLPIGGRKKLDAGISKVYPIEIISYGVQDLVYTRVFSMIVVRETDNFRRLSPFECHGFVCESKHHARQLTYALASAFQIYSQHIKSSQKKNENQINTKKRFVIDLRSPDEIATDLNLDSEA